MATPPPPPPLPPWRPDPSPATLPWPDLLAGAASTTRRLVASHSQSPSVYLRSTIPLARVPPLALAAAAGVLYLAAFAAAAASAHAGFFGRPVKLLASLASVPASLLRLLLTAIPAAPLLLLPMLPIHLAAGLSVLGVLLLVPFWSLAGAAAVVESGAGLSPLRQSCRLLSGARLAALFAFLVFGTGIGVTLWGFGGVASENYDAGAGWAGMAPVVVKVVAGTAVLAVLMLYGMVTNVVLYMHCRALHGELTGEIYNEFANSYVFLPFDEGKDRHIVSVVTVWP
uniref:Uncharacterized protein n=1 Tax=Leersia perrieri TaxID=77586 RepID=A0A0D9XYA0_9ORYZ